MPGFLDSFWHQAALPDLMTDSSVPRTRCLKATAVEPSARRSIIRPRHLQQATVPVGDRTDGFALGALVHARFLFSDPNLTRRPATGDPVRLPDDAAARNESSSSFNHVCDEIELARPFLKPPSLHCRCHLRKSVRSLGEAPWCFVESGTCFRFTVFGWPGLRHSIRSGSPWRPLAAPTPLHTSVFRV
jgi:hypothetical protein